MDWTNDDVHLHRDYHRLKPKDAALFTKVLQRIGRERIAALWAERQVKQTELGITVIDYLRSGSYSEDDGEFFMRSVRDTAPALMQHLQHWTTFFNLNTPWMFMVGGFTILEAVNTPSHHPPGYVTPGRDWSAWYQDLRETFLDDTALAIDIHDRWNPRKESRSSARKRIAVRVEAELEKIEARVQAVSQKRTQKTQTDHFNWLVQYQVLGRSHSAIAREVHHDRVSVSNGVKLTAGLLELPLREQNRGGRPSRSKQSENL